ncbi:MAG: cupin 2 protein [Marmoricola sp.]|nr:cupin 2 protein [Marmoricola sp.]
MPVTHLPAGPPAEPDDPTGGQPDGFVRSPSGVLVPDDVDAFHRRLHHVAPTGLVTQTGQSAGMQRREAISGRTVGSRSLWMGQTHVPPTTRSADHHHGESETAIYVVAGHPVFVFLDVEGEEPVERRVETGPGDYVFVPPWVPHREENPDPSVEAVVVIARTTQEAIVVNLDRLDWTARATEDG